MKIAVFALMLALPLQSWANIVLIAKEDIEVPAKATNVLVLEGDIAGTLAPVCSLMFPPEEYDRTIEKGSQFQIVYSGFYDLSNATPIDLIKLKVAAIEQLFVPPRGRAFKVGQNVKHEQMDEVLKLNRIDDFRVYLKTMRGVKLRSVSSGATVEMMCTTMNLSTFTSRSYTFGALLNFMKQDGKFTFKAGI